MDAGLPSNQWDLCPRDTGFEEALTVELIGRSFIDDQIKGTDQKLSTINDTFDEFLL